MTWAEHVARMEQKCIQILIGKPDGNRSLLTFKFRRTDNIKNDLIEKGRGCDLDSSGSDRDQWRVLVYMVLVRLRNVWLIEKG
jgi:hypothetical protein